MGKPEGLIYVEVVPGGKPLGFRQQGGGVFNSLRTAQYRIDNLTRSGVHFKVWTTMCDWEEVDSDEYS